MRFLDPAPSPRFEQSERIVLHYALLFLLVAIIAALFGFGGIAAGATGIAKALFILFLLCAAVALIVGRSSI
jgi:uncharacterized membrane protein YtjA (UPF0391 family)